MSFIQIESTILIHTEGSRLYLDQKVRQRLLCRVFPKIYLCFFVIQQIQVDSHRVWSGVYLPDTGDHSLILN